MVSKESAKIVNFMAVIAKKAGLPLDAINWDDLGLRKCVDVEKSAKALFLLRTAGIIFSLSKEQIGIDFMDLLI
jgi:hypothetical protein